jgi:hypothetical protein
VGELVHDGDFEKVRKVIKSFLPTIGYYSENLAHCMGVSEFDDTVSDL